MRLPKTTERNARSRDGRDGFTLVELLVVMFIMAVIVALIVGVGRYVTDSAAKKETQATQAIVMRAIQAYQETNPDGEYPQVNDPNETKDLVEKLHNNEKASAILDEVTTLEKGKIVDGFGEEMKYDADGGFGGTPVLISAGPDRHFGREGDEYGHDDIRSDR
jgi:prepilin-type N-terminal cleavage/methylation domain-containing protein